MGANSIPTTIPESYPATLTIDYPDRSLNRLTSFFRILVIIPIAIILALLTGSSWSWGSHLESWRMGMTAGGLLFLPLVLTILFRRKYPKWWFDWNLAITRFSYRVTSYFLLLRDEYPSIEEQQAIHLNLAYPDAANQLGRGWPLIKWFLVIPHLIVLFLLGIASFVIWVIAWFAILFTGRYPRSLFKFIVGVMRWSLRVDAYAILLITDKYPAFSLEP
jgi:hypothetical protein